MIKAQLIFDRIHLQITGSQTFKISGPKAVAGVGSVKHVDGFSLEKFPYIRRYTLLCMLVILTMNQYELYLFL